MGVKRKAEEEVAGEEEVELTQELSEEDKENTKKKEKKSKKAKRESRGEIPAAIKLMDDFDIPEPVSIFNPNDLEFDKRAIKRAMGIEHDKKEPLDDAQALRAVSVIVKVMQYLKPQDIPCHATWCYLRTTKPKLANFKNLLAYHNEIVEYHSKNDEDLVSKKLRYLDAGNIAGVYSE